VHKISHGMNAVAVRASVQCACHFRARISIQVRCITVLVMHIHTRRVQERGPFQIICNHAVISTKTRTIPVLLRATYPSHLSVSSAFVVSLLLFTSLHIFIVLFVSHHTRVYE